MINCQENGDRENASILYSHTQITISYYMNLSCINSGMSLTLKSENSIESKTKSHTIVGILCDDIRKINI